MTAKGVGIQFLPTLADHYLLVSLALKQAQTMLSWSIDTVYVHWVKANHILTSTASTLNPSLLVYVYSF